MTTLTINRFAARATTADAVTGRELAGRLGSLVTHAAQTIDGELAPVADRQVVCMRRLDIVLRLDDGATDEQAGRAWGRELGSAIVRLVEDAGRRPPADADRPRPRAEVVRYRDLTDALSDLLGSLAVGDTGRSWAWTLVGLTAPDLALVPPNRGRAPTSGRSETPRAPVAAGTARTLALNALARHTPVAATALVTAVGSVGLAAVHRLLGQEGWQQIAAALLTRAQGGAGAAILDEAPDQRDEVVLAALRQQAVALGGGFVGEAARSGVTVSSRTRSAWAVVALADGRPDLLVGADTPDLVAALAAELTSDANSAAVARPVPPANEPRADAPAPESSTDVPASPGHRAAVAAADRGRTPVKMPAEDSADVQTPADREDGDGLLTARAGLLFLLNVAAEDALVDLLTDDPRLATCEPGWVLALLAIGLTGSDLDDPAVRVFAGRPVADPLPPLGPGNPAERSAIEEAAATWAAATARRLRDHTGVSDTDDGVLLRRVVDRDGLVIARRGWVDVVLAASGVDVDVRRAGLDLDPGFVPWLGDVVRFRYE
jgi:hypothetical protein